MSETKLDIEHPQGDHPSCGAAPARVAVVGMSVGRICGVRDHASVLAAELEREGVSCAFHWLSRSNVSLRSETREIRGWTRSLAAALADSRPDVVILHYSVFDYCYRGLPLFVRPVMKTLARSRIPSIVVLHEMVYPWRYGGWRGDVWALSQRLALVRVLRAASAAIVTAEERAGWIAQRRWLPRLPIAFAPVFSNLPQPGDSARAGARPHVVGLFGYSYEGVAVVPILEALARLREDMPVELRLLGSPGHPSASASAWLRAADERDLSEALSFSGSLPAEELSDELAACDVLLFADAGGPTSRKGSLAASLASGRPVVAIDGPRTWPALAQSNAASVVEPTPKELAGALGALLSDRRAGDELGARGRAFAEQQMGVSVTAKAVNELYNGIVSRRPSS